MYSQYLPSRPRTTMARKDEFDQFFRRRRALADISSNSNRISLASTKVADRTLAQKATFQRTTERKANTSSLSKNALSTNLTGSKISKARPMGSGIKISHLKHLAPVPKQKSRPAISILDLQHSMDKKVNERPQPPQNDKRISLNYNRIVSESNRAVEKHDNWFKIHRYSFQGNKTRTEETKPGMTRKPIHLVSSVNHVGKFLVAVTVEREGEKSLKEGGTEKIRREEGIEESLNEKGAEESLKEKGTEESLKEEETRGSDVFLLMNGSQIKLETGDAITLGQSKNFIINGADTRVYSTWRVLR